MAAFTQFSRTSLENYLAMFGLGELVSFEPITAGIENSNYHIAARTTSSKDGKFKKL